MSRFEKRIEQGFDRFADHVTPSSTALEAFRNRIAEEADQPNVEIIMLQENEQPPARRNLIWALGAAAALAIVVAGSITLTRGDDATSTDAADLTPPTSVAPEPVPELPHQMSAQLTGDGCDYSGPTDFKVGDDFEITASDRTEERMDVGFAVRKVVDGTSAAELRDEGILTLVEGDAAALLKAAVTEEGTERLMSGTFDVAGTWVVNCFVFSETENFPGEDFPALMFEVVEQS